MRPVLLGDLVAAACAIYPLPEAARAAEAARMLAQARAADVYRKRFGRGHPLWGNGSLMAVACARPRIREPFLNDGTYLRCLAVVIAALEGQIHTGEEKSEKKPRMFLSG